MDITLVVALLSAAIAGVLVLVFQPVEPPTVPAPVAIRVEDN